MKQPTFIFIALLLLSFPFLSGGLELSMESQFIVSMFLVFTIGIAHGSVDNILYLKKTTVKPLSFYLIYLLLVGSYALLWFVFPLFAITSFLLISAYHFGQSQLIDCFKTTSSTLMHKILYAVWGISLLSALLNIKQEEIIAIFSSYEDLRIFEALLGSEYIHYLHVASTVTVVVLLIYFTASRQFSNERMFFEFFILILINFSFAAFPVLPGFTLYFVFLHSLNSLQDEFKFLKNRDQLQIWSFIKKLLPNTIISIAATLVIFASIYFDYIDFSYGFVILVLISSITFPHVFVMEKFYSPDL